MSSAISFPSLKQAARFVCAALILPALIAATPPQSEKTPRKVTLAGAELYVLGFDTLTSFPYRIIDAGTGATPEEITAAQQNDQVPDYIRIYHDQKVILTGYMMPLTIENGLTKKFILMRDVNTCCYGATPNMNDYVIVSVAGAGVKIIQDVPVEMVGKFRIEPKYESGYIVSLFVLEGERFLGVKS